VSMASADVAGSQIGYQLGGRVFLALTVEPYRAAEAEAELVRRFPREIVSLERLMVRAMRAEATARRVHWPLAPAADAASPDSADCKRLLGLAPRAAPRVRDELLALRTPALLIRPGLLARYGQIEVTQRSRGWHWTRGPVRSTGPWRQPCHSHGPKFD
jgi:hypothetical protein